MITQGTKQINQVVDLSKQIINDQVDIKSTFLQMLIRFRTFVNLPGGLYLQFIGNKAPV